MSLSDLIPSTDDVSQSEEFQQFIETHLKYITGKFVINQISVTEAQGSKYRGDFYGLLSAFNFSMDTHYVTMRINGFKSSCDYEGNAFTLKVPSDSEITLLRNVFDTNRKRG